MRSELWTNPSFRIGALGCISWLIYLTIAMTSQSLHEAGSGKRSLLFLLGLFAAVFVCYLFAVRIAVRAKADRRLMLAIVMSTVAFRLTLLFSDPIEEIDLYRYLWDGEVLAHGVSPFRYSPQQVLEASRGDPLPSDLEQLVAVRDTSPELVTILRRIHFGQLPTIYPPVSQAVFAVSALLTPRAASIYWRMVLMKAWFVGFDLLTFWIVLKLLSTSGLPFAWTVAYGWCPLVIKEIANSGHVDALAVCLVTTAAWLAVRALFQVPPGFRRSAEAILAAAVLALAVGAKLYPIVLVPLFGLAFLRRLDRRLSGVAATVFSISTLAVLSPMIPDQELAPLPMNPDPYPRAVEVDDADPPIPPLATAFSPRDPSQSLRVFLDQWEMNDFIFLLVVENLRPERNLKFGQRAWFSVIPDSWREMLISQTEHLTILPHERAPFLLTRGLLSFVFFALALRFAWNASAASSSAIWLYGAFLTLAWFWLLLPTGNPWYLAWCLPFLPFARNRAWLALSGLAFLYYLRFWLSFQFADTHVLGTPYQGATFFDYVVTWIEFAPWLCWLTWYHRPFHCRTSPEDNRP